MPKLPQITPRQLLKILKKHGFQIDHTTGSHFILYNQKTKKRTVVAYHTKNLPKGTLVSILNQAGIDKKELFD